MNQWLYRVGQFLNGLNATVEPSELARAEELLPTDAFELFRRMPVDAQRHSFNVLQTLQTSEQTDVDLDVELDPDLIVAALLHDVGKVAADEAGVPIRLWSRGLLVLVEMIAPQMLAHWSDDNPASGWRYTFYVHQMHPQIGAAWAAEAGCSERTVWLIEHHQETNVNAPPQETVLLTALQWADGQN